jgi:hypothetical protein
MDLSGVTWNDVKLPQTEIGDSSNIKQTNLSDF